MINFNNISSTSAVKAKVELYSGTTLANTCTCSDFLQDFTVSREGDMSKFFGFGICQKLSLTLVDLYRNLTVTSDNHTKVYLGDGTNFDLPFPIFYITEVNRDEKNNSITATAYDRLNEASKHTYEELNLSTPYTFKALSEAISAVLGLSLNIENDNGSFDKVIETANLEGKENLRQILDNIAECTQTIYFINYQNKLTFKRLDKDGEAVHTITKDLYFELDTKTNRRLSAICNATELGDNVESSTGQTGTTQYVRNNPFWELDTNIGSILDSVIADIGGLTIGQFNCDWDGDYRLEIGDKIDLVTEDNGKVTSYVLSDNITYDGTLNEITEWIFTENDTETASNPSTLGERLNQTYARVDKVNKEIELLVSDVSENSSSIAEIKVDLEGIDLTLKQHQDTFESLEIPDITDLENQVETHTEQISQIQLDIDSINLGVAENTTQISNVKNTADANTASINTHSGRLDGLDSATSSLNESVSSNSSKISGIEIDLSGIKSSVSEQETKITTLEGTTEDITEALEQDAEKISSLETATGNLKVTVEENSSKIGTLEVTTDNINASINQANTKITTLEDTTNGLTETVEENSTKIGQLQVTTDNINATVSNQESKITTLEGTTSTHSGQISDLESETGSLSSEVDGLQSTTESLVSTTEEHTSQISQLQIDTSSINATVSEQNTKITTLETTTGELVSTTETHTQEISTLQLNTDSIAATVSNVQSNIETSHEAINENIETLTKEVNLRVTAEDVDIAINSTLENGVDKVTTTTGYTFNSDGLTVSKSDSEISTTISEDGMTIERSGSEVLVADNTGVRAEDLHATTYLIIGDNSRFEDRGSRTACFWMGD